MVEIVKAAACGDRDRGGDREGGGRGGDRDATRRPFFRRKKT